MPGRVRPLSPARELSAKRLPYHLPAGTGLWHLQLDALAGEQPVRISATALMRAITDWSART